MTGVSVLVVGRSPWPHADAGIWFASPPADQPHVCSERVEIWRATSEIDAHPIFFLRKPAHIPLKEHELAALPASCVVAPFQGLWGGVWYDGPIIVKTNGRFGVWVPEGYPCTVTVRSDSDTIESADAVEHLKEQFASALVGSAVTCCRYLTPESGTVALKVAKFDLAEYVLWVLLKKARPQLNVVAEHELDFKRWPSGAKRVCQNLGWSMYERTADNNEAELDLAPLRALSESWCMPLARILTEVSDVIPRSLLG